MNWRTRTLLTALTVALASASAPALAQEPAWLVGVGIGYQKSDDNCPGAAAAGVTCDDKGMTWKIFGGYQFNSYLGVELGLADMGDRTAVVGGVGVVNAQFRIFESLLVATLPVSERFAFYGKAGVYLWDADFDSPAVSPVKADANGNDLTYGLGVRFNLTRQAALRLEWQRYNDVGDPASTGRFNVDVFGLSALFSF